MNHNEAPLADVSREVLPTVLDEKDIKSLFRQVATSLRGEVIHGPYTGLSVHFIHKLGWGNHTYYWLRRGTIGRFSMRHCEPSPIPHFPRGQRSGHLADL